MLHQGNMQTLHDKPIEIKRAVPREQMPAGTRSAARPGAAAYTSAGRAFGPGLTKSAGFGLADGSLPSASSIPAQGFSSLQGLGPRLSSLQSGSLGIPAVRTPSGLADYGEASALSDGGVTAGLSSAQGLDLLLAHQQPRLGLSGALGGLGLDDLALLQSTGLAANMGRTPATADNITGAQSLPGSLEEVLQGMHLGHLSRHQGLGQPGFTSPLLSTTSGNLAQPELRASFALADQAISAGQHW